MSNNKPLIVVIAIVVLGGGYFAYRLYKHEKRLQAQPMQVQQTTSTPSPSVSSSPSAAISQNTVEVTSEGFSPKDITIEAGQTVTWTNKDSVPHQVNSNNHPTHLLYPPLNTIGLLNPGESKSLAFPKSGVYGYHDHLNPSLTGTVTVR